MYLLSYIIWNGSPEIVTIGSFSLRWYGLFFALGFLISQQILYYIHKKEGKPEKDVDTLTIYMVVATIIGARLGHVIFYQPEIIWENPLGIFLPFEFNPFKFTGLQGLASHGGAIGILFALWLYSRKKKPGQNYFQVLDRIVILVALTGALIRLGNYFNSEIIGKPSDSPFSVVFANPLTESITDKRIDTDGIVESVRYVKNDSIHETEVGKEPVLAYIFFKNNVSKEKAQSFVLSDVSYQLANRLDEFFEVKGPLDFGIDKPEGGGYVARLHLTAIARHPAQLYESISCVILFLFLLSIWFKYKNALVPGRLFGIFLIWCFGVRFLLEFLKEPQVKFEETMAINMGQILSIPLVIAGIIILALSFKKTAPKS